MKLAMKHYRGDRTIDGVVVLVGGHPLDQHLDVCRFSENGFEWTYVGAAPRQLALAVLMDHFDTDHERAVRLVEPFTRGVIAKLDNTWELTSDDIETAIEKLDAVPGGGGAARHDLP